MIELNDDEVQKALAEALEKKRVQVEAQERQQRIEEADNQLRRPWGYEDTYAFAVYRAKMVYKKEFVIDEHNRDAVHAANLYFMGDPAFEALQPGYKLTKGLLFRGPVGTGKSLIMKMYARNKRQCYNVISANDIVEGYADIGPRLFNIYRNPHFPPSNDRDVFFQKQVGFGFDDLGTEEDGNHMGNKANVMNSILLARYDRGNMYPFSQTIITTNLDMKGLEKRYGTRFTSRTREMFNVINVLGPDRRQSL